MDWRPLLRAGLFITVLFLIGAGWWFIRNAFLYHGDFLGMNARNLCVASTCTPDFHPLLRQTYQNQGIGVFTMVFGTDYFTLLARSFVAMFGPMSLPTHYYIYETYYRIFIIGLLVCMIPAGRGLYLSWQDQNAVSFSMAVWFWPARSPSFFASIIPIPGISSPRDGT